MNDKKITQSASDFTEDGRALYFGGIPSEFAYKEAKAQGLVVATPGPQELFIDIDSDEEFAAFQINLELFMRYFPAEVTRETPSRNGLPGRHIVVQVKTPGTNLTALERILLQSLLGSDPKREILSYVRVSNGDPTPTLFFEKP